MNHCIELMRKQDTCLYYQWPWTIHLNECT